MKPHDRETPTSPDGLDEHTHTVHFGADEPVAMSIVHAVANTLKRQPLDLEPLSTQVDPEALETLLSGPIGKRDDLSVSFFFAGCTIVVTPTRIHVSPNQSSDE